MVSRVSNLVQELREAASTLPSACSCPCPIGWGLTLQIWPGPFALGLSWAAAVIHLSGLFSTHFLVREGGPPVPWILLSEREAEVYTSPITKLAWTSFGGWGWVTESRPLGILHRWWSPVRIREQETSGGLSEVFPSLMKEGVGVPSF